MLKRYFELHQKKSVLLKARQDLEGILVREEEAEAALRLERDAFNKVRECLINDLNWVQIVLEKAEACEQEAVADCQHALKVFKFKKYKERYEDVKCGVSLRYSLDIGYFLKGEGQDPPESSATPAAKVETSLNTLLAMQCL